MNVRWIKFCAAATAAGAWAPVNFRIEQGVVTIIGVVQSIEIKQQIETCVRRVPGVVRVVDTIEIGSAQGGGGGDSDQMLVTRVRETVLPQIQVSGIDFQCHGGVVTVIGAVPQEEQKQRLVTLVRQVPGVVNVTDQVTVNAEIQGQTRLGQPEQTRLGQSQQTRGIRTSKEMPSMQRLKQAKRTFRPPVVRTRCRRGSKSATSCLPACKIVSNYRRACPNAQMTRRNPILSPS